MLNLHNDRNVLNVTGLNGHNNVNIINVKRLNVNVTRDDLRTDNNVSNNLVTDMNDIRLSRLLITHHTHNGKYLIISDLGVNLRYLIINGLNLNLSSLRIHVSSNFINNLRLLLNVNSANSDNIVNNLNIISHLLDTNRTLRNLIHNDRLTLNNLNLNLHIKRDLHLNNGHLLNIQGDDHNLSVYNLNLICADLNNVINLLYLIGQTLLVHGIHLNNVTLNNGILSQDNDITVHLINLVKLCLNNITNTTDLHLIDDNVNHLHLIIDGHNIDLVRDYLNDDNLTLNNVRILLRKLSISSTRYILHNIMYHLHNNNTKLDLLMLALNNIRIHINHNVNITDAFLLVRYIKVDHSNDPRILLYLYRLVLGLLRLLLLLLHSTYIMNKVSMIIRRLLRLKSDRVNLDIVVTMVRSNCLKVNILATANHSTSYPHEKVSGIRVVPALAKSANVILMSMMNIMSVTTRIITVLLSMLVRFLLFLDVRANM